MPESEEHAHLVTILHSYIANRFCDGNRDLVLTDSVIDSSRTRPPSIEGYVPDAYVMSDRRGTVIIGEAKTLRDLENSHTEAQVSAFLRRCSITNGSTLILAVPWPIERLTRAILTKLQIREESSHVETVVLSEASRIATRRNSTG